MKKLLFHLSCIHFFILIFSVPSMAQFSADMINMKQGDELHYKVYSDGHKYRYEFDESGLKGIVIVDPSNKSTHILLPEEKFVHFTDYLSMRALTNDPYQSFVYYRNNYDARESGRVKKNGYDTRILEIESGGTKLFTCWFSDKLNFPIRIENNQAENMFMELHNIREQSLDPEIFEIPSDYTEVDEKMRPIIPEPPPPDSWNEVTAEIPVSRTFNRGDRVRMIIDHDSYTKIILVNETEKPAKVIRYTYKDGVLKPDSEQGPLKYRTNRLYGGEKKNLTLDLEKGEELAVEIHEGQMRLDIKPEE